MARSKSGRDEPMIGCDYNGWTDVPEDEREWFDEHPEVWTTKTYKVRPAAEAGSSSARLSDLGDTLAAA